MCSSITLLYYIIIDFEHLCLCDKISLILLYVCTATISIIFINKYVIIKINLYRYNSTISYEKQEVPKG